MAKLEGIKILDLSQFLPGPMMTLMMADQGADVLKIEPLTGDPARAMEPHEDGQSIWFRNLNRGKRSLALDLKSEQGIQTLWRLIEDADVFIEGFRPGAMKRLGLAYETVSARNPAIIYCSISAFGQNGPLADHPAHDLAVQSLVGFLSVNDSANCPPAVPGVPSADMAAGLTALSAVLMALIGREKTGRGDYIDCAMFDSLLPWCAHIAGDALGGGAPPQSHSQRSLGGAAFYNVYRTADGQHIVLGGREAKFVANLLNAIDRADLIPLGNASPGKEQEPLRAYLTEIFASRSRDEWVAWFADKDVAFAPVLDFQEALSQPHVTDRDLVRKAGGVHHIAPAIRFAKDDAWKPSPAPLLNDAEADFSRPPQYAWRKQSGLRDDG